MLEHLNDDLWGELSRFLTQRDLAALARCSRGLRAAARRALEDGDALRVRHDRAADAVAAYPGARGLHVRGFPRRYGKLAAEVMGRLEPPPAMPRLERLHLHHPTLAPHQPFWETVFASCPRLRHVKYVGDFFMPNYAADVRHVLDLLVHGAPRLEELDIEGGWLVIRRADTLHPALASAIELARTLPPVRSETLRRLRHACRQVPVGVDAPRLADLEVDEQYERPLLLGDRMGPATMAGVTRLKWDGYWPGFDAGALAGMAALRDLEVSLVSATNPHRLATSLATLAGLPRGLRRLALHIDAWPTRTGDQGAVDWPRPLAHLTCLERLELTMLFPPVSAEDLLAGWLGAGGSVREATMRFHEANSSELSQLCLGEHRDVGWWPSPPPVDGEGLAAWLDAHPLATARIHNFPALRCSHARCVLL